MATPELLSLLCAGSVRYHPAVGRGKPVLTRTEVAAMLSGLSAEATDLAMAKYCDDRDAERMLIARVRTWAAGVAAEQNWEIQRGKPIVCNMSALAVFEVVRPNICKPCGGTGWRLGISRVLMCRACSGTGSRILSVRDVAEALEMPHSTFFKLWRQRYNMIIGKVGSYDSEIDAVLRKQHRVCEGYET